MSRNNKMKRQAIQKKQAKGEMAGKDDSKKSPCPHKQPKATWMTPKKGKKHGTKTGH